MHPHPVPSRTPRCLPAALAVAAAFATTLSQAQVEEPAETARRLVNRNALAQASFSESFAGRLQAPAGFTVQLFASGLKNPRMLDVGPDGTVYVARREQGDVLALRDADGDGRAEQQNVFASNLPTVNGVAVRGADLYMASSTTIWRAPLAAAGTPVVVVVAGLPDGGQHPNRMVRFGPDGGMYVSVGSSCNDCAEDNQLERATMIRYTPDGTQREVIANGLRNTIGYDWHPGTGALWGMDNGTDFRGDGLPPEELNQIKPGANYGWPICFARRTVDTMTNALPERMALKPGDSQPAPGQKLTREQYCAQTEPAVLLAPAHAAPLAMRFYSGSQFPAAYRNDAFVALRGSWGRAEPSGYKVVRVRFNAAGQALSIDDFLTGFLTSSGADAQILGRPTGIALAADGALLVSDDTNGAIYKVSYTGTR